MPESIYSQLLLGFLTAVSLITPVPSYSADRCSSFFLSDAATFSEKMVWLEQDSVERKKWIWAQNHEIHEMMKSSPNARAVSDWVKDVGASALTLDRAKISSDQELRLVYQGLGKGTELLMSKKDGATETLFSNRQILKNLNATLLNFSVSPSETKVLLTYVKKGSFDDYFHLVYDLSQRKVVSPEIPSAAKTPVWRDDSHFMTEVYDPAANISRVHEFAMTGKETNGFGQGWIISRKGKWAALYSKQTGTVIIGSNGKMIRPSGASPGEIIGESEGNLYFVDKTNEFGEIFSVAINGPAEQAGRSVIANKSRLVSGASLLGDFLIYNSDLGNDRKIVIADPEGKIVSKIVLPECCSGHAVKWETPGERLVVNLKSDVVGKTEFVYDLKRERFVSNDIEKRMLSVNGVEFVSEVINVKAQDGVAIPVRLIYKKGTPLDGSRPAFMEVYGGFKLPGYFSPDFKPLNMGFLMNGGIVVHPAVRGGNEFGPDWSKEASLKNKTRTFDDVIAVADKLAELRYTSPQKLILTGASNGGLVTAASGLRSPESFGLVIPVSGVEDMFGKERLDRRMGNGWSAEYGNSGNKWYAKYLKSYSPVEKAASAKAVPRFLIIEGLNDSRVNPAHSMKLSEVLDNNSDEAAEKSKLLALRNSGHALYSFYYQDLIAWRVNSVIWTTIYDHLGMKFEPPPAKR